MLFPLALAALVAPALATPSDCRPLREGVAPTPSPNTPEAFASFSYYASTANSTAHPANYERFMVGGDAAVRGDESYLTFRELSSYSVDQCAGACNELASCASFNIYFHRHPSLAPGPACPNPPANVVVRCALFSAPMSASQASNYGQQRGPADGNGERFEVLVAGSNAYNRLVSPGGRVTVTNTVIVSATKIVTNTVPRTTCVE